MKEINLNQEELSFIDREIIKKKSLQIDIAEYKNFDTPMIDTLINWLGDLIGYDKEKGDIDDTGAFADDIISKLLLLLVQRGDI